VPPTVGLRLPGFKAVLDRKLTGTVRLANTLIDTPMTLARELTFQSLVTAHYAALYRFALSLVGAEADACDLTQQTFLLWATKGHQLRNPAKVKAWLFTTLHREFLGKQRKIVRFPHHGLQDVEAELPHATPEAADRLDSTAVLEALARMEDDCRAPIALFYLEDYAYKEIAEILDIPLGTVKSRISRGIVRLQAALLRDPGSRPGSTQENHG